VTSGRLGLGGALVVAPAVGLAGALGGALLVGVAPGVVAGAAVPSSPEDALHADTASAATSATVARLGLRSAPTDTSCNTWDDGAVTTTPAPPVPTFKRRAGRVTPTQGDALERLWPALGLPVGGRPLDVAAVFGRTAPLVLEIGFGMGEATATLAHAEPHRDVLAVDVHTPGHGNLLKLVEARGLTNVRVMSGDARVVLTQMLPPASVTAVRVFFPDPWPKARHAKRRLVTRAFVDLVADRLVDDGVLHVATDVAAYADGVRAALDGHPDLRLTDDVPWRPPTRFERRGLRAGRPPRDIAAVRRRRA
jgi:tRNA (guanine-N7-)-methyltransferase